MRQHALYIVLLSSAAQAACSTFKPHKISYNDDPKRAVFLADPPKPVQVVEIPKPLPLQGQLKPLPAGRLAAREPKDPTERVANANEAVRVQPTRGGYINAVQVYPYTVGVLYQVYNAPDQVTDIALQEGYRERDWANQTLSHRAQAHASRSRHQSRKGLFVIGLYMRNCGQSEPHSLGRAIPEPFVTTLGNSGKWFASRTSNNQVAG